MRIIAFATIAAALAAASAFFLYYTVRLVYVNLAVADIARHRQTGMYIGAVAFPLASLAFGYLSFRCFRTAVRTGRS
jgi:hypothetical protein